MTSDILARLKLLQHGDSFFPSGAIAFSFGLESLCADQRVRNADDVRVFLFTQLSLRWATCDRTVIAHVWNVSTNIDEVLQTDKLVEASTLPRELREGSRRAGTALLSVHVKLGTKAAAEYSNLQKSGTANGHLATIQGLLWKNIGLSLQDTLAVSAHAMCAGILGAAIRLGVIGHLSAQEILGSVHHALAEILATPPPSLEMICSYTPMADIAVMRHETQSSRLFSN
ncbi:MAG: urease accessory protein UreF [Gammaproteobacteria bacterium]|nr:urease accessory protein UreF [Gammaproteobacteria bacterium]